MQVLSRNIFPLSPRACSTVLSHSSDSAILCLRAKPDNPASATHPTRPRPHPHHLPHQPNHNHNRNHAPPSLQNLPSMGLLLLRALLQLLRPRHAPPRRVPPRIRPDLPRRRRHDDVPRRGAPAGRAALRAPRGTATSGRDARGYRVEGCCVPSVEHAGVRYGPFGEWWLVFILFWCWAVLMCDGRMIWRRKRGIRRSFAISRPNSGLGGLVRLSRWSNRR